VFCIFKSFDGKKRIKLNKFKKKMDEESYEINSSVQDLRNNIDIPAVHNSTIEYEEFIVWKHRIENDRSLRGKLFYYGLFLPWGFLSSLEPLWQAGLIILVTSGVMYGSILEDGNLLRGLLVGSMSGAVTTVFLLMLWLYTFHAGSFVDEKSKLRYRNEYHKGTVCTYFFVVTLFIAVSVMLAAVDKHCVPNSRVTCEMSCNITDIFKKGV